MQNKFFNKWLPTFILIQPVFDVITSFMTANGINVTVGILVKMLILLFAGIYLIFIDKYKRKYNFIYLGLITILCLGNVYVNFDILKTHFSEYAGYLMKYVYFTVLLFYFLKWYKNGNYIKLYELKLSFFIIALVFLLSWITSTAFDTYLPDSGKYGISGWFFSGNEIGALLSIIFPIVLYNGLYNEKCHKWENILTIIIGVSLLSLGTKVGLLGYFITIIGYVIYRLIAMIKIKLDKKFMFVLLCLIVPLIFWNKIPAVYNTSLRYESLDIDNEEITEEEREERINFLIYSGRNGYIAKMVQMRKDISASERMFGKFYEREDKTLFITEQDPFDIYFSFGIFGTIILFVPLLYLLFSSLKIYFKKIKIRFFDIESIMCFISIVIALGVSTMSGHTLLAPSVSAFMILIIISFYKRCSENLNKEDKKQMLIGSVHMEVGGIERTLISLLKRIDYSKFNVDLMLLKPEGQFYKEIPKDVNVITPYDSSFLRKIVLSDNKFCKIIKHLLFNYYTGWLFVNNKKYDTAISYSGYYPFVDAYVGYSYAKKKIIWVHSDISYYYTHNIKYRRKFDRTKSKYDYFNNIVFVSEGIMDNFNKLFPKYKKKTTFMWNLLSVSNVDNKEKVKKLSGVFKIISVGRIVEDKNFEIILDICKILINKQIKCKFYIIGLGQLYDKLKIEIKKNKLENYIFLLGVSNNVSDYLQQADLYLATSKSEGLSMVVLESLMCGLPVVATDVSGHRDIYKYIAPRGSMILAKNSAEALASTIIKVYSNKKKKKVGFNVDEYNNKVMKKFYKIID